MNLKLIIVGIVGLIGLVAMIVLSPFTIVSSTEQAIVFNWGRIDRVLGEGLHWITPISESVQKIDVTTQKAEVEANAASKDLQTVNAKLAINYNIPIEKVEVLWRTFEGRQNERIIFPSIQEAVKSATAKYTAEELITKRELVKDDILSNLKERLSPVNILVSNVSITDFDFSASFNQAIEAKVTAEQNALAAKNKLEQIKYEAEQRVATAEAEARAIRLQSDAANNEKYVSLKRLEVNLEFAKRWNGVLPVNLYGSAPIPFLQLGN